MVIILLYKISWKTMNEFKNILYTKPLELQHHLDTHRHQESAHEPQQWWLNYKKKTIHAAKHAGCQYKTPSMHCSMNKLYSRMFLLFSLFAFILVLFWLWLFSRLFCDVQSRTDFLIFFIIFDSHQFWDSYADCWCLCVFKFCRSSIHLFVHIVLRTVSHNIWLL